LNRGTADVVKIKLHTLLLIAMAIAVSATAQNPSPSQNESLGEKIERFIAGATPTPQPTSTPQKKHRKTSRKKKEEEAGQDETSRYFEPVRPIEQGPRGRAGTHASPAAKETHKATPAASFTETPAPTPAISAAEIGDYENYPADVRKILDFALSLTSRNLRYKYGSADPDRGGMDSSGFVYYVLSANGIKDVPRDARAQYVWVRKAGNFRVVLAQTGDTFELDELKPGDILFWIGAYSISREANITQTMIYLGRDKATNQRLMVGASSGGTYKGESRLGVGVFDFKVGRLKSKSENEPGAIFIGYGRPPGLSEQ
jgi:cell wall-associated NlpC family hydrolase